MSSKKYKSLEGRPHSALLSLIQRAFQDADFPRLSDEFHLQKWAEVGVDWELSQGAMVDGELKAMVLLVPLRGGVLNLVTAVDPAAQKQGLSHGLLTHVLEQLRGTDFTFMGLEVRSDNVAAIRAYTKVGFRITRRLVSYKGSLNLDIAPEEFVHKAGPLKALPSGAYGLDARDEVLERHAGDFESHELFLHGSRVASCIFRPEHLAIIKLEAAPPFGKHADALLSAMKLDRETVGIVNVDEEHTDLVQFLEEKGLVRYLTQFEMRKMIL